MDYVTWRSGDVEATAWRRPDGRWQLGLPDRTESWPALLAGRPGAVDRLLVSATEGSWDAPLADLGFTAVRTEQVWHLPVAGLTTAITSAAHTFTPVTGCDLDRVRDLDNIVRQQIPGTEDWTGTVEDLRATLSDDEFDPLLYLIAVHTGSGSYDGLIRVWYRRPRPRLGCLGVVPQWRRTRLAAGLLGAVATILRGRAVTEILTETDLRNPDSHPMAARHGGIPRHRTTEWALTAG
ncbi:GNAT family N-acetyltransferase [Occultella glacieicola]|uniref:GNAT family N-acetyltransferase n=1 Tax=Occultella glacieicola TaxID=2518684 RepID=A0ABY2E0S9_9MICO|nr:GNAT family N-acetyltransferase [Occultella glacieicola]TDE90867.1 GNAT family N-acetyltransferase [Occultella glacieicola]